MKLSYVLVLATAIFMSACNKERTAPNGQKMTILREGEGEIGAPGKYLVMNMLYKDAKDSVWNDTKVRGIPVVIMVADTAAKKDEKGMESAFRALKKGDSIMLKVKAQSLFENTWKQPVPPSVKADQELTFLIGVVDITDEAGIRALQENIQAREVEKSKAAAMGQLAADTTAIDTYLAGKNIVAQKDKSGIRYVITKEGSGEKPTLSNTVKVNYKGMLLDNGSVFDQSTAPVEFGLSGLIQGWQIAFQLLSRGTSATLYIPSSLAYGANGAGSQIPPNANLIFEVELIDFK